MRCAVINDLIPGKGPTFMPNMFHTQYTHKKAHNRHTHTYVINKQNEAKKTQIKLSGRKQNEKHKEENDNKYLAKNHKRKK